MAYTQEISELVETTLYLRRWLNLISISLVLNEILFEIERQKPSVVDFSVLLLNWKWKNYRLQVRVPKFIITMGDQSISLNFFLTKIT